LSIVSTVLTIMLVRGNKWNHYISGVVEKETK
jgi:hypothetical protein